MANATDVDQGQGPILVTGATGYVGGRLVPLLLQHGYRVRTTVSDPQDAGSSWWSDDVETVTMDITDRDQVMKACEGVQAVFFLVHGMGGDDFAEQDRAAAENVAQAVAAHHVDRVVYLSGIVPDVDHSELSEHITSRLEVEEILSASPAIVVTLRAAVLMGSGSTSFEIIRQVSERLPVQTVPDWMDSRVQPIAVVDALTALVGALEIPQETCHYDIGGPEALPYPDLLDRYAEIAGLQRPQVSVPLLPTDLVGALTGALTDVPTSTVQALVQSLRHDMVAADDRFRELLPPGYGLVGLDESIRRGLAQEDESVPAQDRDPMGPMPSDPHWSDGGNNRPLAARAVDAVRSVLGGA